VVIDSTGNIYVSDISGRVQKFDSSANFISSTPPTFGQVGQIFGFSLDSTGNIYVVDRSNYRVQLLTPAGNVLQTIGSPGSGNGEFLEPWGIVRDNAGNMYVTDSLNNRVQKFDSSGNFLLSFGSSFVNPGSGNGEFTYPTGIASDAMGNK
jgi:DNA-binding beta-propeller fold protein YncE